MQTTVTLFHLVKFRFLFGHFCLFIRHWPCATSYPFLISVLSASVSDFSASTLLSAFTSLSSHVRLIPNLGSSTSPSSLPPHHRLLFIPMSPTGSQLCYTSSGRPLKKCLFLLLSFPLSLWFSDLLCFTLGVMV